MDPKPAQIMQLSTKIDIEAAAEQVWSALTDEINEWWPAEFFTGGEPKSRRYLLEARPGGRMCETWDGGGGVLWATVIASDPSQSLHVIGTEFPGWGGPNLWYGSWDLQQNDAGTQLKYTESIIGQVSVKHVHQKAAGWTFLWQCLKAHVEGASAPTWEP